MSVVFVRRWVVAFGVAITVIIVIALILKKVSEWAWLLLGEGPYYSPSCLFFFMGMVTKLQTGKYIDSTLQDKQSVGSNEAFDREATRSGIMNEIRKIPVCSCGKPTAIQCEFIPNFPCGCLIADNLSFHDSKLTLFMHLSLKAHGPGFLSRQFSSCEVWVVGYCEPHWIQSLQEFSPRRLVDSGWKRCSYFSYPFHSQEWSISNFPWNPRNITSHSVKNLAFHITPKFKEYVLPIPFKRNV